MTTVKQVEAVPTLSDCTATVILPTDRKELPMTIPVLHYCPMCGEVLDADSPHILCARCEEDEAEKWIDYVAERNQAWMPY